MSTHRHLTVLVIGSGQQGSAVARSLQAAGHAVILMSRDVQTPRALALARKGCTLVRCDVEDRNALRATMSGVDAVFAVGPTLEAGTRDEVHHGRMLVDAAREALVAHFIYSSIASADQGTSVDQFESKLAVERYLRSSDVPFTIVGPVFFMENLLTGWLLSGIRDGRLTMPLPPRRQLQLVSVRDLANFVTLVVRRREHFLGKRIDIAGDEQTGQRIASIVGRAAGRALEYAPQPHAGLRAENPSRARMFSWLDDVGHAVNIPKLRSEYPRVGWQSLEHWAERRNWTSVFRHAGGHAASPA